MIATIEKLSSQVKDEAGKRYGRLTVLGYAGAGKFNRALWLCRCDCGVEKIVTGHCLRHGLSKSCGCSKRRDEVGNRYGYLTVLEVVGANKHGHIDWLCHCVCGKEQVVSAMHLRRGDKRSCGCRKKLPKGEASFNAIYRSVRDNAGKRSKKFELTKEQVRDIVTQPCQYCGAAPAQTMTDSRFNGTFKYNGIDRVNNSRDYVEDNVVPCCKICNYAKRTQTLAEFKSWLTRAYKHFIEGGA